MTKALPRCNQERIDCFAYRNGRCCALRATIFNKVCPFYKTKDQYQDELILYPYNPPSIVDRREEETEDDI